MPGTISAGELPPDVRKQIEAKTGARVRASKRRSMTLDQVRTAAIRVLAVVAELTPAERERVLRHAGKMNDV